MLMPLAIVLIVSFTDDGYVRFPPSSFGIRWYQAAIENVNFQRGLYFSLQTGAIVAVLSGIFGISAALGLARARFPGRDAIVSVLTMPLALPHVVLAIALLQLFGAFVIPTSPYGLVAGHVLITLPYVLRWTMTSLQAIDPQLERASATLGASRWQTLRYVILPTIAPGAAAGVVLAFLLSFDEVTISIFLSLPGNTTLPAEIFAFASQGSDPVVTAVSGLMILLTCVVVVVVENIFGVLRMISAET
jgi:putative spermidine/putrescine transport system permease protein